ncbi:ATPase [Actinobacillus succinogenes]|uniref:Carbohydrate kinase FGGY n=1 Tax=Actinobacillus succinogenes (strain ATCC 55618 / DSM 22257 / CCUG 43843 / 130Z) TaxID=339671 RepID=A6VLM1_ACTSZ|nr:FGGY-family carbohydrate kinase [Actinobacillus succinogenes]ABR73868.1 carbohydrate kinase FGGY [Actinobacillus succinogenes 130Z]PHI39681.1 ATPase [Actinobacillus succinogenes]
MRDVQAVITSGEASIGIEFGSTRIKAVLINVQGDILATGGFTWENHFVDGIWTYPQDEIWQGLQAAYRALTDNVKEKYGLSVTKAKAIGISGMMHGYMPFDQRGGLLVPFRTWRNNITAKSSQKLTALFNYNIPQRWSVSHLYQAILNREQHVGEIDFFTTLAGYVHWRLTDEKVLGVGEASGMFPIDPKTGSYYQSMLNRFDELVAPYSYPWKITEILPKVLTAGQFAGKLTEQGAKLLDPTGQLQAGIPLCPPEGDAGTGMVATNSIKVNTGNISAGTSAFAMIVLEKELTRVYEQLDSVTTPAGKLVAMAHANNCTSDINAWINLFGENLKVFGLEVEPDKLYETLFLKALEGEANCGNLLAYGFYSGEHSVGLSEGCPTFMHPANSNFTLANFIRSHLYSAFGAMKLGVDILIQREKVKIARILAHGGIFKTPNVASKILASAINVPVAVMKTANEGGAWGIALLANYLAAYQAGESLEDYLDNRIFVRSEIQITRPDAEMAKGYAEFIRTYQKGIPVVRAAVDAFHYEI